MIYLGRYTYPQADDFSFSAYTHSTWVTTNSFFAVIKQAFLTAILYWGSWAGTFSSVFFFSLQPEAFFTRGYMIVPMLFILILSSSVWLFVNSILIRVIKLDGNTSRTIASFIIIYVIWNIPSACQAFYWYNSAAHYILSFAMMLVTTSLIIIGNQTKYNWLMIILASFTGIMVGGGNFISALLMAILYAFFIIFYICTKQKKMILWIIPAILMYAAFALNIMAPGNAERQGVMNVEPDNPVSAIINSFGYALHYCFSEWMSIFIVLLMLIIVPFIWRGLDKCEFSFKYPGLVLFISFCLVASMFTPAAYAERSAGPGRVQNIIFTFFIICLTLNEVYVLGWLKKRHLSIDINVKMSLYMGICISLLLFCGLIFYRYDDKYCNMLTALSIIKNGKAVEYAEIVEKNMEILNGDEPIVTIHRVIGGPNFFYSNEIDDWKSGTKSYFDKELILYEE